MSPVLVGLLSIIVGWIVSALSLFLAGRVISGKEASLGEALLIALVGPIIVGITGSVTTLLVGPVIGLLVSLLIWLWVIKSVFGVGWGSAFLISILALFMFIVAVAIVSFALGVTKIFFFKFL
jgi:hypothetical protein